MSEAAEKKQVGLFCLNIPETLRLTTKLNQSDFEVVSWAGKIEPIRSQTANSYSNFLRDREEAVGRLKHFGGPEDRIKARRRIITSGYQDFCYQVVPLLEEGDIVAYMGEPTRGWEECQQVFNERGVRFLDLAILNRPGRNIRTGAQVLVGGDQRGYLSMLDVFNAIASPNGSKQLVSEVIGSGHTVKDFFEAYKMGEITIDEIRRDADYLVDDFDLYPNIMERLVEENVFSI